MSINNIARHRREERVRLCPNTCWVGQYELAHNTAECTEMQNKNQGRAVSQNTGEKSFLKEQWSIV